MYPGYHTPRDLVLKVIGAGLRGKRRDLHHDAQAFVQGIRPPLRSLGEDLIPRRGPFLLVVNHYYRPGFAVWWLALGVSSLLPMPHTWVTASEWTAPGRWYEQAKTGATRFLFQRLAEVYGLLSMPPMPPRPKEVEERARSVRRALAYVESQPEAVLCLAPEGRDVDPRGPGQPPPGTGRFISLLTRGGMPILPVGGWEQGGELVIRFGEPYRLERTAEGAGTKEETDRRTAQTVMRSIAALLPLPLRGEFK